MNVNVTVLLGSVAGAAAEALEKAAGAQTRPAHSPTGTALRGGKEGGREPQREGCDSNRNTSRRRYRMMYEEEISRRTLGGGGGECEVSVKGKAHTARQNKRGQKQKYCRKSAKIMNK